jgi:Carboxypeptidase regulatory-like domain
MIKLFGTMLAVLFLVAGTARGQGVGASGDIRGTVTDPTGAVVSKAAVTATDAEKGIKRSAVTDPDGEYRFTALPPTTYDISVQFSGFQTYIQKGVVVNVGQTVTLDFHLTVSRAAESVEVTTEAPVVDTQQSAQANVIDTQTIQDLPINRRDYLTFSLLAPAVTDSTRMAGDQDFRVKQTPQSGLSFYGSNGRGNSVTVDGGEVNDDAGGVRLTLSQEAVQEFQINRSNYAPDLGGASGASINIVSKSGSNQVHGSVFGLFRNDAFDERNPFAFTQPLAPGATFNPALPDIAGQPTQDSLTREQFGGSFGFPISKDKTFGFVAAEGLRSNAQNAVPLFTNTSVFRPTGAQQPIIAGLAAGTGNVPCLTGQPAIASATCAAILTNILTINPAASPRNLFLVNQFEANGGLFAYDTREYFVSGRLDHQFSERNQAYLRYSFAHDTEQSPDVQSLVGFSAGSSIAPAYDNTLQAAWFHQFSPRTLNEARVQWNYSHFDVIPNAPGTVGLNMPGFGSLNSNIFLPSKTIMRRYEFADNFSMVRGHHSLKFGGYELIRGNHTESDTFFPGRFQFGNLPGGILSPCLQLPAACATPTSQSLLSANAAQISALQSFSLGLPQFYQQGFGSAIYAINRPWTAFFASDSWSLRSNFTFTFGVRYELDSQYGRLKTDTNNFAPRIAFAWDPFSDHKMAVRGGYGIFYSPIYGQIPNVIQTLGLVNGIQQIAQVFCPLTGCGGGLTSAAIFQTLFAQGKVQCTAPAAGNPACITPADLAQFGITVKHDGTAPLSVFFSGQPNYQNPYSQQAELSVERQVGRSFSVSVSGVYVHTIGLPTSVDQNALPTAPFRTVALANGSTTTFHVWNAAPCAVVVNNPCFAKLLTLQDNFYSSRGAAIYEGGILEIKKRFSDHMSLMVNYTFSKAFSSSTDFNSDFGPQDNTNLALERGLSDFDQRHKLVIATVLESPWKNRFLSGFQVAPIVRYNSGHPFNLLAGTDVNGDRHSTNDRPIGVAHNTGVGPDFATFDMRVTKRFKFTEKMSLDIIGEGFNIFNQINYASVNNVVNPNLLLPTTAGGLGFTTANLHGSASIAPNQPLGFTSAFPMRQLQLGAKLIF